MDLSLTDEQLEIVVNNVANTKDGLLLIGHLIAEANIYRRGVLENSDRENFLRGVSAHGIYIKELLEVFAPDKYLELLKIGVEKTKEEQENNVKR